MALRKELLKSIWYAFTALDVEKSGKVSKSQLKVRGARGAGEAGRRSHPSARRRGARRGLSSSQGCPATQRPRRGGGPNWVSGASWPGGCCCPPS